MQTTSQKLLSSEGGVLTSDAELLAAAAKLEKASDRVIFRWLSADVLGHALLATVLSGVVYVVDAAITPTSFASITLTPHAMTGFVLGLLLTARIVLGSMRAYEAGALLPKFCQSCRTLAVLATHVSETLTISAGAESEKKATAEFRYELVRLLNLGWYTFKAMLMDVKVKSAPPALCTGKSKLESQVLSSVKNPTVFIVKMISKLIEKQQAAGRVSSESVTIFSAELSKIVETYHSAQSMQLSPPSVALEGFVKFFTVVWVYTVCPLISLTELNSNAQGDNVMGFVLTICYSFIIALFYFGLFEAGKLVEKPIKAVIAITDLESMTTTLSDDLANLVDDPDGEVPVFLPAMV